MTLEEQLSDIGDYKNWIEITPIEEGMSGDNKYHILRSNGVELILRTADIKDYKRHCDNAMFSQYIHNTLGLNMNLPIEVAACCHDTLVYTLYSWVDGRDANDKIRNLHTPEQARFGEKAGVLLKRIHSVKAPEGIMPWGLYFGLRLDEMLGRFRYLRVSFRGDKQTMDFIENNRDLIKGRPQTAVHGDFHSGNLLLNEDDEYGIIDFGRWCWGDPYMDFQCLRRSCSVAFSRGQINGYFGGDIPSDFFGLMALYTAVDILRRICDASALGRKELDEAVSFAERTVREYHGFESNIPSWY